MTAFATIADAFDATLKAMTDVVMRHGSAEGYVAPDPDTIYSPLVMAVQSINDGTIDPTLRNAVFKMLLASRIRYQYGDYDTALSIAAGCKYCATAGKD